MKNINKIKKITSTEGSSALKGFFAVMALFLLVIVIFSFGSKDKDDNELKNKKVVAKSSGAKVIKDSFLGEKGDEIFAENGELAIDKSLLDDGDIHYFTYYSKKAGKNVYFFALKAPDGTYRVAANACEVCFGAKKGFTQVGDSVKCENCGVIYAKSKIAKEKGGCNPGPISDDAIVEGENILVDVSDVEAVSYLFT